MSRVSAVCVLLGLAAIVYSCQPPDCDNPDCGTCGTYIDMDSLLGAHACWGWGSIYPVPKLAAHTAKA